jgi:hypothetical protein
VSGSPSPWCQKVEIDYEIRSCFADSLGFPLSLSYGVKKVHLFACFLQNYLLCNRCKHKFFSEDQRCLSLSCAHSPNTLDTLDTQCYIYSWSFDIHLFKYASGVLIGSCYTLAIYKMDVEFYKLNYLQMYK